MKEQAREVERQKYLKLTSHRRYGHDNHGRKCYPLIRRLSPKSLMDVGTGQGEFPVWVYNHICKDVHGVDFAFEPTHEGINWINAPAHDIPVEDSSVEILTSFDMLEHLLEWEVDGVFKEWRRILADGFVFSIAYKQERSHRKLHLHNTIKPPEWWIDKIEDNMNIDVKAYKKYMYGTLLTTIE